MSDLKVVCVGGGLGAPTVMRGLKKHTEHITGLIGVTDSGRSTGKVRIALDVPAPGDIRNALVVLAEGELVLRRLFQQRFRTDKSEDLDGMAFGNLFLAALTQQEGTFLGAVQAASRLLGVRGQVLPVTLYNTHLCAVLADGTVVEQEVNVRAPGKAPIARIFLKDAHVDPCEGTIEAIEEADLITLGPGSLFTTVCACLLVPEIARAIARSDAPVVYVANTTRQPGQTDALGLADTSRACSSTSAGAASTPCSSTTTRPPTTCAGTTRRRDLTTSSRRRTSSRRSARSGSSRCSPRSSTSGRARGSYGTSLTRSGTIPTAWPTRSWPSCCLERDWDALTAFFDFPKEHWKHLRTSNVVESPFAALRLRTNAAKRLKNVAKATALIWKVLRVIESHWRKLDAPELLKDVYEGRRFVDGKPITRSMERSAA